jgi:hypothetical protein
MPAPAYVVYRADSPATLQTYLNGLAQGTEVIAILLSPSTGGQSGTGWDFIVVSRH